MSGIIQDRCRWAGWAGIEIVFEIESRRCHYRDEKGRERIELRSIPSPLPFRFLSDPLANITQRIGRRTAFIKPCAIAPTRGSSGRFNQRIPRIPTSLAGRSNPCRRTRLPYRDINSHSPVTHATFILADVSTHSDLASRSNLVHQQMTTLRANYAAPIFFLPSVILLLD